MVEILFLSTRTSPVKLETSSNNWNEVEKEALKAGVDFKDMKATLVRSRKQPYGVVLEKDSLLPTGEGNLIIQLTQVKMKGAVDYDLVFTSDDVKTMTYRELRKTLREIRKTADEHRDQHILSLIGNYTHDTIEELKEKLDTVYRELTKTPSTNFEDFVRKVQVLQEEVKRLKERVLLIEKENNIFSEELVNSL